MKLRISIILVLLGFFVSIAQAQSNCCQIQTGGVQTSGGEGSVPSNSNGPGGVYIATQTETYPIACKNTQTNSNCNSTTVPNNVVTATGAGANYNGNFVPCNPTFLTTLSQASPTSGTAASFKNQGTGYTSVSSSGGCVQQNPQPFAISTCIVVACTTSSGGGAGGQKCGACNPCTAEKNQRRDFLPVQGTCGSSPVIVDVSGQGFWLTNAANGVMFDISGTGLPVQMGWTAPGADNAFLALPGADGLVHTGKQLFGDWTPQPPSNYPNGFAALTVFDLPANGGNGDGIIDARDAIFSSLRLWIDANHDGISQPDELHTLPSLGVNSISLAYKSSGRTDQYGNLFRFRAQVNPGTPSDVGKTAYDVFFVTQGTPTTTAQACTAPPATGKRPTSSILKY